MKVRKFFFFALLALLSVSCDDDGMVGDDVISTQDLLQVKKLTASDIDVSSFHPDALQTDGQTLMLLGGYWQKDFGMINSEIAMQFRYDSVYMSKEKALAGQIEIDSVFLVLIYNQFWGDSLSVNKINVYELNNTVDNYTPYYSNENPSDYYSDSDLLGSAFFTGKELGVPDSIYNTSGYFTKLKVPLKRELAERFLENFESVTESLSAYQEFFKGLYVKPVLGNRTLLAIPTELQDSYIDYNSLQFFYHYKDADGVEEDSIRQQNFFFNNECGRFNRFDYDFTGSVFEGQEEVISEDVYVRGLGGANIRVKLPEIGSHPELVPLPDNDSLRIAINSAKLTFYVDQDKIDVSEEEIPSRLVIRQDSIVTDTLTGAKSYLRLLDDDPSFDGETDGDYYIGGTLNKDDYSYTINITEQVQYWLGQPQEQRDLIIQPVKNRINPALAIIKGPNASDKPFKLEIIYSRY